MHQTIEFENDLYKQFDPANQKIRSQVQVIDRQAIIEPSGDADEIRAKYRNEFEQDEDL